MNWSGSDNPDYVAVAFNGGNKKASAARVAKIPRPLSQHIARVYKPSSTINYAEQALQVKRAQRHQIDIDCGRAHT